MSHPLRVARLDLLDRFDLPGMISWNDAPWNDDLVAEDQYCGSGCRIVLTEANISPAAGFTPIK